MLFEYPIATTKNSLYNIDANVKKAVAKSGVASGIAVVFCPHTTAGITINENGDPDVVNDLIFGLDAAFPDRPQFRHFEGNSAAHLKSSAVGASLTLIIENGAILLGTWQSIYFCEFDAPRNRRFYVKIVAN